MIPGADLLEAPARQAAVAKETSHRPWPLPGGTWVLAQTWEDLLFAHWRVPAEALRRLVPPELELDEHDGSAWLGLTPFLLTGFRLRGMFPLPWISTFPELNVRTYVTAEDKPGIWFFSLDTSSRLAVEGARRAYKLPYFQAQMAAEPWSGGRRYSCHRLGADHHFEGRYRPAGDVFNAQHGSVEAFLTERYCLYALDEGRIARAEIHHPPWPLQTAEASLDANTMAPEGIPLEGEPLCHFARRQDVLIWPLERL